MELGVADISRLVVKAINTPTEAEEFVPENHLLVGFCNPNKLAPYTNWITAFSSMGGGKPLPSPFAPGTFVRPPFDGVDSKGIGMLFTEGWIVSRFMWTIFALLLVSAIIGFAWGAASDIEQGLAAAQYVVAIAALGVTLVAFLDAVDRKA